jgi:parvulin-like peptidyl-prolyl isomerase
MKRDVLIAFATAAVVAAACYLYATTHPQTPPAVHAKTPGTTAVPRNEKIIMRVNGEPVTEREFAIFLSSFPEQMQPYLSNPAVRRQVADQIVKLKVLEQEARRLGADEDPDLAAKMRFGHANLAAEYAAQKLARRPTDAELRALYEREKANISGLELAHILIAYQGGEAPQREGSKPRSADEAFELARKAERQLEGGAQFEALALTLSDDVASARHGGVLGPVNPAQLPPEIASVVATLTPGKISHPVRTRYGVHIFKVNGPKAQPFEAVRPMLEQRARQEAVGNAMEKLRKEAKVDYDPAFFPVSKPGARPPA